MKDNEREREEILNDISDSRVFAARMSRISAMMSGMDVFQLDRLEKAAREIIEGKGVEN